MPLLGLIYRHKSSLEETLASHPSCRAFTIIKMWKKQSKWAPSETRIKNKTFNIPIDAGQGYSSIQMNDIMPFPTSWMDLEMVTLCEGSQTEKDEDPRT